MKKNILTLFLCTATFLMNGCDVMRQLGNAYTLTQCTYAFNTVSKLSVAGIDVLKQLSPLDLLKITPLLTGSAKDVPMKLALDIDITNPNLADAGMQGMQYILSIDGIQFTTGQLNDLVSVPSLSTKTMTMNLGFDLATLFSGPSKDAALNIVKNIVGIGNNPSKVKLEIKPSFKIGTQLMTSPLFIPLEFTL